MPPRCWLSGWAARTFLIPCVRPDFVPRIERAAAVRHELDLRICQGRRASSVDRPATGAIVKSGTGTLEAMLLRRPMVVAYRLGSLSYALARLLVRTEFVGLPNLLAGRELVPERLQGQATAEKISRCAAESTRQTGVCRRKLCRRFRCCTSNCAGTPANGPQTRSWNSWEMPSRQP